MNSDGLMQACRVDPLMTLLSYRGSKRHTKAQAWLEDAGLEFILMIFK